MGDRGRPLGRDNIFNGDPNKIINSGSIWSQSDTREETVHAKML